MRRKLFAILACCFLPLAGWASPAANGRQLFEETCSDCHGADGQGGDGFEGPIFGNQSINELALYIERAMPEGDPDLIVGEEARSVAEFIYHDFYSPQARVEKGLPTAPKLDLMRLTVPQYRNSVADLLAAFTPEVPPTVSRKKKRKQKNDEPRKEEADPLLLQSGDRGFHARYYESNGMTKTGIRLIERLDDRIAFDFEEGSPGNGIAADQFCIIWQGSVIARDTGFYEFKIRSPNGLRLYVNLDPPEGRGGLRDDSSGHGQAALIDGWVNSSEMRELSARVFLLGGRKYPIRLEFFKYKEKLASIDLQWKPPHSVWRILDADSVVPQVAARTFVVDTPFPADDRSLGYERGNSVSREWHFAANQAAIEVAEEVVGRLPLLAKFEKRKRRRRDAANEGDRDSKNVVTQQLEKAKSFVLDFATTAFRRPLTVAEKRLYSESIFSEGAHLETAAKRAVLFTLKSPSFLYPELCRADTEDSENLPFPDGYLIASRLALAVWDSIPDRELVELAEKGQLQNVDQLRAQAERMIRDPRAKAKLNGFFSSLA